MPSPIAFFAFKRPEQTRRSLEALAANRLAEQSELTIFCDGPRNAEEMRLTEAVRACCGTITGFASVRVVKRPANLGCAASIIAGLREMFALHDRLIVIEDDILTSPHTLSFFNTCLDKYRDEPAVFSIAAWSLPPRRMRVPADYPYDAFFSPRFNGWGWAGWKDRFDSVDWDVADYADFARQRVLRRAFNLGGPDLAPLLDDQMAGRIDAWDIRADYARFKQGRVQLSPLRSYTTNIGMGTGTHCTQFTSWWDNDVSAAAPNPRLPDHVFLDARLVRAACRGYAPRALPLRAANKIWRALRGKDLFDA